MKNISLWNGLAAIDSFPTLDKDITTTVAIIGGGMTGILCAYLLKEQNIDYVLIDSNKIGSGVTSSTTGKITAQHGLIYNKLIKDVGEEKAKQYLHANIDAFQNYKRIIYKENIQCDFEELPNVIYTLSNSEKIEQEIIALNKLGVPCEKIEQSTLPIKIKCGIKTFYSAQFNPLAFIKSISKGLNIYENTEAIKIKGKKVVTKKGTITAKKIIVASHFPIKDTPGFYYAKMSQDKSYLCALKWAGKMDAMYVDEQDIGLTFRNYNNYLIMGGLDHRTGDGDGCRYKELENIVKEMYPRASIEYMWSTQDCMPIDDIAHIGRYSVFTPNLYVATGYKKWGMSTSMAAAMIITDMILEKENANQEVFSPGRILKKQAVKNSINNTKYYVKGLSKRFFAKAHNSIYDIKKGQGRIIKVENHKRAVYYDEAGRYHFTDANCHHLGCQLSFNTDEKSWDCPCYGSRYDVDGNVISNPTAQ